MIGARSGVRVALIGCSKTKLVAPAPARALYRGDLFRRAVAYAEATCTRWAVLSAEHGLVLPDQVIAPYERTLATMAPAERAAWQVRVAEQIEFVFPDPSTVFVLLAGRGYRLPFEGAHLVRPYLAPMRGFGIGAQRAWLARETERALHGEEAAA